MGFPSPASDYVEGRIDLNKVLMPHPAHMLMMRHRSASLSSTERCREKQATKWRSSSAIIFSWADCSEQVLSRKTVKLSTGKGWRVTKC